MSNKAKREYLYILSTYFAVCDIKYEDQCHMQLIKNEIVHCEISFWPLKSVLNKADYRFYIKRIVCDIINVSLRVFRIISYISFSFIIFSITVVYDVSWINDIVSNPSPLYFLFLCYTVFISRQEKISNKWIQFVFDLNPSIQLLYSITWNIISKVDMNRNIGRDSN